MIYNLPSTLPMKKKYIMLSMIISLSKRNVIDVYLGPLVDDMKILWKMIDVFDTCYEDKFVCEQCYFSQ